MTWEACEDFLSLKGEQFEITIEPRPAYCDRGKWIAKVFQIGGMAPELDEQDGWPRYYFDLERAKAECEAWMLKRGQ